MKSKLLVALALFSLSSAAVAQAPSVDDRLVRSRAVEAVIWGMPAVNYDLMLQPALKAGSKENEIIYWSRPVDWHNQTLTPNPDALYFMIFFNTKEVGPIVIDVPPADDGSFAANIDTVWQMPLEDAGTYGADKGAGGKYLILPPGYSGSQPDGYIVVRSETFAGYALFRSNLASHSEADIAKAAKYGKRLKVYPLSQAANPPETKFTDAKDILYDSTIPYDLRFFQSLDRVVQTEPWQTRDKAMIDQLKSIGIEKGKAFNPDAKAIAVLNGAAADARGVLDRMYARGFPPFFTSSRWAVPAFPDLVKAGSSGYAETDMYPVDARALTYSIGYIGIKRLGTAQLYLIAAKDKKGNTMAGGKTYRLNVPPNVPVDLYWSVTAHDRQTHALIKNMTRASRASNVADVQKNSDGSIDIYFGPKAPVGKETNWVPTDPKRDFELLFRVYGPKKEFFDKVWVLPDVEQIAAR
ncbi:DUF1254 domain-containing protein [Chelatococcus asaccharovorans]|uniref:DUF1254 domain-containing protein n=1 Tax=Chelatococcus asaccharovorans TaxID=28210 RepID=UPI00224C6A2B|nr:DUF1254 domain-containing protein [Chelatococcus asaccharovorans]CAH1661355.1 conserved exported hypothetical protein [Chelatococcus asaccharovorans]CAH1689828.1 conserved exported hypothetical protein [Chelatococcus asaccharovorans]